MSRSKPTILVLMGGYWPGHEATGPNQNLRHMLSELADDYTFKIVARDRPPGASLPLTQSGVWTGHDLAQVHYCRISWRGAEGLSDLLRTGDYDILALNGFFDREFTIPALALRRLGRIPPKPTVLSVHGEMGAGALRLKAGRKRAYITLSRHSRLLRSIWMHATSAREADDIHAQDIGSQGILNAPNLCRLVSPNASRTKLSDGTLRLVFVGRVARMKNLHFAIDVLRQVRAPVTFDIIGPIVDPAYWAEIRHSISSLPRHIEVTHCGEITNDLVPDRIAGADLFFLPTLGENFGHAIFEALSSGVPVLISDRTPWQNLARQSAGWSFPLHEPQTFVEAIENLTAMTAPQRAALRVGARAVAERYVVGTDAAGAARRMFETVLYDRPAAAVPVAAHNPVAAE
ncbi:glycosyltransferase family 4 protein [Leptospira interrogans]